MKFTDEQNDIIASAGNIKINAVAGSGKTTTVIAYAKARPAAAKILYLAFNKSVKLEAAKKFEAAGLQNVTVETAHSLAYKNIIFKQGYKVNATGYKTHELAAVLGLSGNGEKHYEFMAANHINKFAALFCNSNKLKVQDVNYLDIIGDAKARSFVKSFYPYLEKNVRLFLAKMDRGEIEVTHDFYLKKFQLQNPVLPYDYILFDEGQDASPAMLDIFLKQQATKVIVGDTHQQIYSWRYAVNSLEKTNFSTLHLSQSFRFGNSIAALANSILKWKDIIGAPKPVAIRGCSTPANSKTKAVIGRTNLGLLLKAIEYTNENKSIKHIYFEGNIHSYTYADEGASLYDVLNLHNGKSGQIRDALIKSMASITDLEDYIEKTEDAQLGMMVEIVKKYGNDIYDILKSLKEKHVENTDKQKADMVFSTVHRCKGMEYDSVYLVNDFITEDKVKRIFNDVAEDENKIQKLNEEINLLYVAVTRAKNILHFPEDLLPENFPSYSNIKIIKKEAAPSYEAGSATKKTKPVFNKYKEGSTKAYSVELIRQKTAEAYKPWSLEEDEELRQMFVNDVSDTDIIKHFKRTASAIRSRQRKLGLK